MEKSPLSSPHSGPSLNTAVSSPIPTELKGLPDSLLHSVLAKVSEAGGGFSHALVCQKWADVSMEAQRRIIVREGARIADSDLLLELSGFANIRELQLKGNSALRLSDRFFLGIGGTCPHLESIIILEESSSKTAEFSAEGLRGMISSLSGLKSIVLREASTTEWDVPDSLSGLGSLKVLDVGSTYHRRTCSVLRIPPSIRELSFCNEGNWGVAEEERGLQGVRVLIADVIASEVIPEALWVAGSLRSLTINTMYCPHLSPGVGRLTALRQLKLDLYKVTDLPDCFSTLELLTQLRLGLFDVQALPDSLWSLTSLKHLYLHCMKLRSIDSRVGQLQRLTNLDVSSEQALNFPSSLCGHSALRKLRLNLPKVQPGFELCASALTDVDISVNEEIDLSRFLRDCPSLSSLCLYNAKDASSLLGNAGLPLTLRNLRIYGPFVLQYVWPNSFSCYSNLETLKIVTCDILQELPSSIGECGKLTKLTVDGCYNLRSLPPQLGSLGSLRTLHIKDCSELQCLPQSVGQLSSLEHLELVSLSQLRNIPNSLGAAHRLCALKIGDCTELSCLPEPVGQLSLLTSLCVSSCPLVSELPADMSQLLSLRVLKLEQLPALRSLPKGVENITTLHSLTVSECRSVQEMPLELGGLENLREVVIKSCPNLLYLPPSIGDLLQLRKLHLEALERVDCIPEQIGQLSGLRDLFICNLRSLTSLPDSMTLLTGLAELSIDGCHSLGLVADLLESLSEISEESKLGLRRLMETGGQEH